MRRIPAYTLLITAAFYFLAGCGDTGGADPARTASGEGTLAQKEITVNILQSKIEIADELKKMEYDYEKESGVKLKFVTYGGGADYEYGLVSRFQAGDAPDVYVNGGYAKLNPWLERAEDLSDQPWVADLPESALAPITRNGRIYGMPQALEGFGFAYNKKLFAKAGIKELPDTLDKLEAACKKLKSAGIRPFSNSYAEWWALGMHNFNLLLVHQPDPQKFIKDIASGKAKTKDNKYVSGWLRLLDLTREYGQSNPTVTGDYASSANDFFAGKAAMIQQGNWIQPDIEKIDVSLDAGFLPMPLGNEPEDKVCVGVPNYWVVYSGSKYKKECKQWLNWMVTSDTGRRYIQDELRFISPFRSVKTGNYKGLNASLFEYISKGRTYGWEYPRLPDGTTELIGAAMIKYLGGQATKQELLDEIDKVIINRTKDSLK